MPYKINITIATQYVEPQSAPEKNRYLFAYTITIQNAGDEPAKLINRSWTITDANGNIQQTRGIGVVGQQPLLKPQESFQYTSGCMLETPVGSMEGKYEMVSENGEHFIVPIPAFSLAVPNTLH